MVLLRSQVLPVVTCVAGELLPDSVKMKEIRFFETSGSTN